jgi:hypothetical protein
MPPSPDLLLEKLNELNKAGIKEDARKTVR